MTAQRKNVVILYFLIPNSMLAILYIKAWTLYSSNFWWIKIM